MNKNSVFATFKPSVLAISHFRWFSKSEFTAFSSSVEDLPEAVRLESSANRQGFVLLRHLGRSLIYSRKNSGPKMEP